MASISSLEELLKNIQENSSFKFKIKVIPNSKNDSLEFCEEFIKVKIKQRAIEGKANKAVIDYLSNQLKIAKSKITILNGHKASIKTINVVN